MPAPLDIGLIQHALANEAVDGWLLYDFHGLNPIAQRLAGVEDRHTTRRWFYFIPTTGEPTRIVHAVEPGVLDELSGTTCVYAGRHALEDALTSVLGRCRRVAMEYSPFAGIPYLSRVDAGTVELIRRLGPEVVSSGDLVGQFEAAWDDRAIQTHRRAAVALHEIKDRAFDLARTHLQGGQTITEYEIQQEMVRWFAEKGLVTDAPPIVAVEENAGNPHYSPDAVRSRSLHPGELLLLDLWGKLDSPGAVYADITWVGVAGAPRAEVGKAFQTIVRARDTGVELVQSRLRSGLTVRGFEVDQAVRQIVTDAGFGAAFVHRTGHSLGADVHGNGVNMDDYETHDDRRLVRGTAFTIEPGIYLNNFGVRTEINMIVGEKTAEVTGPAQMEFVRLL
jgi:Xaa-Pro aminopeptidase